MIYSFFYMNYQSIILYQWKNDLKLVSVGIVEFDYRLICILFKPVGINIGYLLWAMVFLMVEMRDLNIT